MATFSMMLGQYHVSPLEQEERRKWYQILKTATQITHKFEKVAPASASTGAREIVIVLPAEMFCTSAGELLALRPPSFSLRVSMVIKRFATCERFTRNRHVFASGIKL